MVKNFKEFRNLWDIKKSLTYVKIGSFFLFAFFLFFVAIFSIRKIDIFKGTYIITVTFDFAEGLNASSPVRFCGVDVGEVKKVVVKEVKEKENKFLVYVYAKIKNEVKIPRDSYFFINSLSLFGEKYLEIDPPEEITGYIRKGEIVKGISPVPLFDIFASFSKTLKEVREFVKEGKVKTSLEKIFTNMEEISFEVKGLVQDMKNKQGTIGKLFYDDSLYKTTEEFIADLKAHPWKLLYRPKEGRRRKK